MASGAGQNLFNPVPADSLRELSADRPDATESPITVDAGHIQIETSLFDWRREVREDTYTAMSTNFKLGLTESTDIQFIFDSFVWENPGDSASNAEGFGDVTVRLKWNLWGNDGGKTAFALFPFVKVPTSTAVSNGAWEGGLILPFATTIGEDISLGLMAEIDVVDEGSGSHQFEFVHTGVLGFDLTERLGLFTEYVGVVTETHYEAYASGGLTWSVNSNLLLDIGAQVGLNDEAEDIGVFTGFTVRY